MEVVLLQLIKDVASELLQYCDKPSDVTRDVYWPPPSPCSLKDVVVVAIGCGGGVIVVDEGMWV